MKANLQPIAKALAALDFTTENERIAELQARESEFRDAKERAEARCSEIARFLHEGARPNGRAVADALLAAGSASAAATAGPSQDTMEAERVSLRAGIRDLQHRAEDTRTEIDVIQEQAMGRVRAVIEPLVAEIVDEARAIVAQLPPLYASLVAISDASKSGSFATNKLRAAIVGAQGVEALLDYRRTQDVPEELSAALRTLIGKVPAIRDARFIDVIPMP